MAFFFPLQQVICFTKSKSCQENQINKQPIIEQFLSSLPWKLAELDSWFLSHQLWKKLAFPLTSILQQRKGANSDIFLFVYFYHVWLFATELVTPKACRLLKNMDLHSARHFMIFKKNQCDIVLLVFLQCSFLYLWHMEISSTLPLLRSYK